MTNRIENVRIWSTRLSPTEAEISVTVCPESLFSSTQVRGRLVGPRCPYSNTVEISYPLREFDREYESTGTPRISLRTLIPEPCFWDPETPFLYQVHLELWQTGQRCDQKSMNHAIATFQLGARGLRWNGRPLILNGLECQTCSADEARSLHKAGFNALLVPTAEDAPWQIGDIFGFLIFGRLAAPKDIAARPDAKNHVSALGWVLDEELLHHPVIEAIGPSFLSSDKHVVGLELKKTASFPIPEGFSFLLCQEELLPQVAAIGLPRLVRCVDRPSDLARTSDVFGTIVEVPKQIP